MGLLMVDLRKDGWTVKEWKDDMRIKKSMEMTSDRREWKKKTFCTYPT
jgi:hypothetical protein